MLVAFLVEKGNRSGSQRTVESYSRMLWHFFKSTTPDQVTPKRKSPNHETPPDKDEAPSEARNYLSISSLLTASRSMWRSTIPSAATLTYLMGMTYSCLTMRPRFTPNSSPLT